MKKINLVFILAIACALFVCASGASATTYYVPDEFTKIQWAVDNASAGDTIIVRDGTYNENVEVDKQLTIKSENGSANCIVDGGGSGDVITLNADGITIEGFTVRDSGWWPDAGIKAVSNANKIAYNSITNNWHGIYLYYSSDNAIYNNTASNNENGIFLWWSSNNTIYNNTANSNNDDGIELYYSSNNTIYNNTVNSNNEDGFFLYDSSSNTIYNNTTNSNNDHGIELDDSSNNTIYNNIASSNNYYGIYLWWYSSNNTIYNNTASNNENGIYLYSSSNNKIYLNNFINNTDQVSSSFSTNIWNSTEKITYTYNGNQYISYLGNYWSDYKGSDADGDGIGDTPYSIDGDKDYYPLMKPFENYIIAPEVAIFDTGSPPNPYPSIAGAHYGTITPNKTIIATKLYTYPCPGTGGHTESIKLEENGTLIANGTWEGYTGDWHNITLHNATGDAPYVRLLKGHKYNYTIVTGSYPQIIHDHSKEVTGGTITCTSFTDVNGRSYTNWIPAIRLVGESAESAEVRDENPKLAFSSHYKPINVSVTPNVPSYQLPLTSGDISNFEKINTVFNLSESAKELLRSNGFVIINYGHEDDITAPYEYLKWHEVPIFVTADTLLHLYHIQFNEILKGVEEREFFDELVTMSKAMLVRAEHDYNNFSDSEPELKEAARRNVAYFSVALKLLQTPTEGYNGNGSENIREINFSIPNYVKDEVEAEIANIEKHEGFQPSPIFNSNANCSCSDSCCYCEDYSQYVPRGHYTQSEKLKRYFKAMMWYGRMAFLLKGCNGDDALVSEHDAKISTIQAALISSELPEVKAGDKPVQEIWDRIYAVTAFFVGKADDLTPYEYANALNSTFGVDFNLSELSDEANLLALKAELAKMRSPEIYGGSGVCVVYPPITREKLYECLDKTKGMRFMGQRFVPDSYMFQQLVSPAVGMYVGNDTPFTMCITQLGPERCFPRGLDVMAVLGSEMAEDILREEGDTEYGSKSDNKPADVCSNSNNTSYDIQLNTLKSDFAGVNLSEWNQNLYWSWLYTLKPLLTEFEDGYPTFMQTEAWQKKELQTALASWTELRHDTILYAKQSYTPRPVAMPPEPVGYVEPVPEFYARLLSLTQMTEEGLADLDVLTETEQERLQSLERILERLVNISKAELENKELNESDYEFIRNFGESMDSIVAGVDARGMNTTIVADVHTDCNTKKVLEEGVGYVNLILVAYNVPDGRIIVGAGPVFSYYEFKHPMDDRLTDEKWKEMLENENEPPEVQEWVKGIMG